MSAAASPHLKRGDTVEQPKFQFVLNGFSETAGMRIFQFEGVASDRSRSAFTVRADLALSRRYGIKIQELPLLCRKFLEGCEEGELKRTFTFTEAEMCAHASNAAARAEAAKLKKAPRRPPANTNNRLGAAWRGPQP